MFAKYIEKFDNYHIKNKTLTEYTKNLNIKNVEKIYDFQVVCSDILWLFNVEHNNTDKSIKAVWESSVIPNWLLDSAQDWVEEKIVSELPQDLPLSKKTQNGKRRSRKTFPLQKEKAKLGAGHRRLASRQRWQKFNIYKASRRLRPSNIHF